MHTQSQYKEIILNITPIKFFLKDETVVAPQQLIVPQYTPAIIKTKGPSPKIGIHPGNKYN